MKNKKVSKLIIIGNGFDLHHGLLTSYKNFFEEGLKYELKAKYEKYLNELNEKSIIFDKNSNSWYSLEEAYRQIILFYREKILNNSGITSKNRENFERKIKEINVFFNKLRQELQQYLLNISDDNINYKVDSYVLNELSEADKIFSFNYTNTLEKLYKIIPSKIIHVHGKLDTFPIFGHSNFLEFEKSTSNYNYGCDYIIQNITLLGEKSALYSINAQTLKESPPSPQKPIFISNKSNIMFGDKGIQRLIMLQNILDFPTSKFNILIGSLNQIYQNPFGNFPKELGIINYLQTDFDDQLKITIIGHGLESDIDLLNKIPSINKTIKIFDGPQYSNSKLVNLAEKVFGVDKKKIEITEYEW